MARLNIQGDTGLANFANARAQSFQQQTFLAEARKPTYAQEQTPDTASKASRSTRANGACVVEDLPIQSLTPKERSSQKKASRQRTLKPLITPQSLAPLSMVSDTRLKQPDSSRLSKLKCKATPKRVTKTTFNDRDIDGSGGYSEYETRKPHCSSQGESKQQGVRSENHLLFPGDGLSIKNALDQDERHTRRLQLVNIHDPFMINAMRDLTLEDENDKENVGIKEHDVVDLTQSPNVQEYKLPVTPAKADRSPTTSLSDQNHPAVLQFSPPRGKARSPWKKPLNDPPVTPPPTSPSKSRLTSPSKKSQKIPSPNHRPSIDAFWSQTVINEWNDQYSPHKILESPKKNKTKDPKGSCLDSYPPSPSASPRKSPQKRDRSVMEARQAFERRRAELAASFLCELDQKLTGGRIGEIAAAWGGVRIVWNTNLRSTAGRATWKSNNMGNPDGTVAVGPLYDAFIELATHVIDSEERLMNTLAHEFCHLANRMISGINDKPHGQEFQNWAKRCSQAFADRGINVTTKHSYDIHYDFVWECTTCGREYQRHSRSINVARQGCSTCNSTTLVQTRPPPRNANATVYQRFVSEYFRVVKQENPNAPQGELMQILGRKYREQRENGVMVNRELDGLKNAMNALEVITLDD